MDKGIPPVKSGSLQVEGGGGYCMHAAIYFIVCRHNAVPELPSRAVDMFTRQTLYYIRGKDPYTYTAREHIIL